MCILVTKYYPMSHACDMVADIYFPLSDFYKNLFPLQILLQTISLSIKQEFFKQKTSIVSLILVCNLTKLTNLSLSTLLFFNNYFFLIVFMQIATNLSN